MADAREDAIAALDRYGVDLAAWPDAGLAAAARRLALSDRDFRARLDAASALDAGFASLGDLMDAEIAAGGAPERVATAVLAVPRRRVQVRQWAALAAAVVIAAALGAVADVTVFAPGGDAPFEVVTLDPLAFDALGTLSP